MRLKKMTDLGLKQFTKYLSELRAGKNSEYPKFILEDDEYSEPYGSEAIEVVEKKFETKLEMLQEIDNILKNPNRKDVDSDTHLWAWLSLFYFESIVKKDKNGNIALESTNISYIPEITIWNRYYKHKILGPYLIYKMHQDHLEDTYPLLKTRPDQMGEFMGNVMGRQSMVSNKTIIKLLKKLYWDEKNESLKKGASSRIGKSGSSAGSGSISRLGVYLKQLDMTYDLHSIPLEKLLELLPKEYNKFKYKTSLF
ncbi:hypothetical protein [Sulfurovum sp. AR]|uniref:hypothetical protein n=1 Tax=Sulfurovum sp. AR TaxID=1165841 RepID=UPI00025C4CC4|nr:hypothetical protein [Sulfurovum sp. AR]EIF51372.1 hypothetical protein SULAR_03972 [Sulfurovum sp. AR]